MRTTAHLTRSPRLALLLALAALMLSAGVVNAAPGYNGPLRSAGERIDADSPPAQTVNAPTARSNTRRDRNDPAPTTSVIPNPLPDPRVSPAVSATGVAPKPLPDPRVAPVASTTAVAPNPLPDPRVSAGASAIGVVPKPLPDPRVGPKPMPGPR
jgi:hypothetical protein